MNFKALLLTAAVAATGFVATPAQAVVFGNPNGGADVVVNNSGNNLVEQHQQQRNGAALLNILMTTGANHSVDYTNTTNYETNSSQYDVVDQEWNGTRMECLNANGHTISYSYDSCF